MRERGETQESLYALPSWGRNKREEWEEWEEWEEEESRGRKGDVGGGDRYPDCPYPFFTFSLSNPFLG